MNATEGFVLNIASAQLTYFNLTTVPPIAFPGTYSSTGAYALSDSGSVAGCYFDGGNLTVMPDLPQVGSFQCVDYIRSPDGSSVQSFVPPLGSTTYSGNSYFLNDSGITGINQAGQIAGSFIDAAGSHGYIGAPYPTMAYPTISLVDVIPGPPVQAVFSVADPVAGVYNILTIQNNCTITIAPFTPGQTSPIAVTATKTDPSLKAIVGIQTWNLLANLTDFDPALVTVYGAGGPKTETLTDVPAAEHVLMISNGNPGLERLNVYVNGRTVAVALKASEKRIVNLSAWMKLKNNTLEFSGTGPNNALAAVVVKAGGARDRFTRR